jgi:energy-converting hydrogenase Eha subunit A
MMGDRRATLITFLVLCSLIISLSSIAVVRATEDFWTTLEPMPTARGGIGVAVVDGKIYAIGGSYDSLGETEEYDPATNTWTKKTPMPTPRIWFGIAVVENKIYVIGGDSGNWEVGITPTNVNEVYDPETDTWSTGTTMPTARYALGVAIIDDVLYAVGGREGWVGAPVSAANEQYTPAGYIPEFPLWTPTLLVLVVFAVTVVIYKRRLPKQATQQSY